MKIKKMKSSEYVQLRVKLLFRLLSIFGIALVITVVAYRLVWHYKGADRIVSAFQRFFKIEYWDAYNIYQHLFRNNREIIWLMAIFIVFFLSLYSAIVEWFTEYSDMVNQGIADLADDESEIRLPPEMAVTEQKLNTVRQTLYHRKMEAGLAEQRKNDLVMYLAHDIRTPLTSVIGYLNLLEEAKDMPSEQREKYIHITLSKANHLEKMVNEFFEITRYNNRQIDLSKEVIDLYYMFVQLTDEFYSALLKHGNTITLQADESLTVYGDPDKLARVFGNILKNAIAYSYPGTEILITAKENAGNVEILFKNKGRTIPKEKISSMFEKFYRLDESRMSDTGGSGLGLAIAKEIVNLHGGTITAESQDDTVTFLVILCKEDFSP